MRITGGQELDDQSLARLNVDTYLFAGLHAVEEDGRRHDRSVGIALVVLGIFQKDARIEQVRNEVLLADRMMVLAFKLLTCAGEVSGRQACPWPPTQWFAG